MHSGPWYQFGNAMHYDDKFDAINQMLLWIWETLKAGDLWISQENQKCLCCSLTKHKTVMSPRIILQRRLKMHLI